MGKLDVDYSALTKYFCEPKNKQVIEPKLLEKLEEDKKNQTVKILDDKKLMNLGIALNKFRLSPDDLKNIIENLYDDKINIEEIEKIIDLSPNDEEVLKLKEYKGDINLISLGERYCHMLAGINKFQVIL